MTIACKMKTYFTKDATETCANFLFWFMRSDEATFETNESFTSEHKGRTNIAVWSVYTVYVYVLFFALMQYLFKVFIHLDVYMILHSIYFPNIRFCPQSKLQKCVRFLYKKCKNAICGQNRMSTPQGILYNTLLISKLKQISMQQCLRTNKKLTKLDKIRSKPCERHTKTCTVCLLSHLSILFKPDVFG